LNQSPGCMEEEIIQQLNILHAMCDYLHCSKSRDYVAAARVEIFKKLEVDRLLALLHNGPGLTGVRVPLPHPTSTRRA
jgi:hypothetical protein